VNETLQRAIDALQIRDVYLRESTSFLAEDFEPKYDEDLNGLEVQTQHFVKSTSVLELEQEGEALQNLYRVSIQLGVRWVGAATSDGARDNVDEDPVKAAITALMVAEYSMRDDPGEEALTEFALRNASYHVWPYWRELLASQCMRMNLPKLVLPAVQFAKSTEPDPASQR
jgi:hypothetical protein